MTTQETNNHTPETSEDIYDFTKGWTARGISPVEIVKGGSWYKPWTWFSKKYRVPNFFVTVHRKSGTVDIYSPGKPFTLNRDDRVLIGSKRQNNQQGKT